MRTLLKYPGGKWKTADWILSYFPNHKVYLEPYFGSGALFFKKTPSYIETINDIDGNIVNLFKVCREFPEELRKALNLTPFSREEFENCYKMDDGDCVERARRTLVRYHQSFGTSNSSKKSWRNVQTYGGPRCATMWNYLPETVIDICERLKNAQIENVEALKLIERYNHKDTLIYCDPPYLPELRKKNLYSNEMTKDDHIALLQKLLNIKSKVIISGYDSVLYNDMLKGWYTDERPAIVQMGLHRTEKIWMNFEVEKQCTMEI